MNPVPDVPVYKVGAVVLRDVDTDDPRILLVKPIAKNPDEQEQVPWVLPRGSRKYFDESKGKWRDARKFADALAHAGDKWESLSHALSRELKEEAGIPHVILRGSDVYEMGARNYTSRSGDAYPIYWYGVALDRTGVENMSNTPMDAYAVAWFTMDEMKAAVAEGSARRGYLEIAKEALDFVQEKRRER